MGLGLFGLSSSRSRSSSTSQSSGSSVSRSADSVFGADLFAELFGDASAAAAGINSDALTTTANRLFDSGAGFIDQLGELGGGGPAGAGEQYLTDQLGGGDDLIAGEIDALQADLSEFFGETVLPGIRGDAIAAGGLGGDRQGVAEGIAGRGLTREFARGALSIRKSAQERRASIAETLAGLQTSRRLSAAGAGLTALPQQFQLAEAGGLAALSPFLALADILGDPTVLTDSFAFGEESSTSSSSSKAKSYSLSLGA